MNGAIPEYSTIGGVSAFGQEGIIGHWLRIPGPTSYGSGSTAETVTKEWDGTGQVAIVTGASSGLGAESARVLALRGCEVVMAVRDVAKGEKVATAIRDKYTKAKLNVMKLDLGSLQSVRDFAAAFKKTGQPLHILLENAGIMAAPFTKTVDGFESQFATNHLGHFLLTKLLLDDLIQTAKRDGTQGRIVCTSSAAHFFSYPEGLRVIGWTTSAGYDPFRAYGQSKLCNVLFARELNERLKDEPVVAVSCHPGGIWTNLDHSIEMNALVKWASFVLLSPCLKSVGQGAATQTYLATARDVKGGEYYADVNICPSSKLAHSRELGKKLWDLSEGLCKQ